MYMCMSVDGVQKETVRLRCGQVIESVAIITVMFRNDSWMDIVVHNTV